ncbi:hypothetical protein H4R34_002173 [Dimargaris verticillata]|uniref:Uncharacterized protein n=1 Tax=Dimargaris verticillata TaxID=2761393 RepID=A0A9W8B321_9FUNG|nr:hypothetical protein H4R34_002173 [Dimargaris verticillata]
MTFLPKRSARIKSLSWYSRVKARYNAVKDLIVAGSNCALGPLDVLTVYWSALAVPEYAHYQLPALDQEHKQLLEHTVQIPQGISHTSDNALEQGDPQGNVWRPWDTLTVWELAQYHPVLLAIVQGQLPLFEQVWTKVKSEKFSLYDYIQPHPASKATFVYLYLLLLQVAVICDRQRIVEKLLQPVVLLDAAKKHSIDLYVAGLAVKYSAYTVQEYFEQGHDEMWHLFDTLVAHHRQEQDVELSTDIMMAELEKHIRQYDLELSLVSPLKVHIPVQVVRD